ncbi:uncharacterized protein BO96DRAFT_430267 [Aspergillus niger CBS 101883]|uniref:uncharacterized protein n=1 Tax=Aspergillus lacticoffeatus (strain CBS 101883) TaxID=1450533 RepID=UPI000D804D33|nr:uncharacterized protein BO96DRAFT_430267 [Aspergillus niger CBS 101883]PYH60320.1 hypothetical protein BO96DRAFT_430267 [Aspergillus niger CBS 101883]
MPQTDKTSITDDWVRYLPLLAEPASRTARQKKSSITAHGPLGYRLAILTSLASHGGPMIHRMFAWNATRVNHDYGVERARRWAAKQSMPHARKIRHALPGDNNSSSESEHLHESIHQASPGTPRKWDSRSGLRFPHLKAAAGADHQAGVIIRLLLPYCLEHSDEAANILNGNYCVLHQMPKLELHIRI